MLHVDSGSSNRSFEQARMRTRKEGNIYLQLASRRDNQCDRFLSSNESAVGYFIEKKFTDTVFEEVFSRREDTTT